LRNAFLGKTNGAYLYILHLRVYTSRRPWGNTRRRNIRQRDATNAHSYVLSYPTVTYPNPNKTTKPKKKKNISERRQQSEHLIPNTGYTNVTMIRLFVCTTYTRIEARAKAGVRGGGKACARAWDGVKASKQRVSGDKARKGRGSGRTEGARVGASGSRRVGRGSEGARVEGVGKKRAPHRWRAPLGVRIERGGGSERKTDNGARRNPPTNADTLTYIRSLDG
jgi:hypothetical protein